MASIKELQDILSAIRLTSCLLLPLILNEDEDNFLATNTSGKGKNRQIRSIIEHMNWDVL